jgi:hypothetical protein
VPPPRMMGETPSRIKKQATWFVVTFPPPLPLLLGPRNGTKSEGEVAP